MITIAYVPRYHWDYDAADGHTITAQMQNMARSAQGAFDAIRLGGGHASAEYIEAMTRNYPLTHVLTIELRRIKQRPRKQP